MVKLFLPIQLCCLEISGMMIFAPYIFIGLLSSTSGQKVAISLSNDYANKSETVTVTCKVVDDVINDIVRITKDGTIALTCPSPPAPCITTVAAYSAVQDKTAGTTTMTISATDISRDTGNWKCQYGRTFSKAASLTVGTPVSITKMNELNTTAVIETSCTFPCAGVHVSCSVGGTDINCLCNISSSAKCGDLKERFLTITIYLDLFNGSASGLLTVHINNGFTAVSKTGNHNYTFTATTKTGVTIDDCAHKSILELAFGLGVCSSIICVICIMIWVKRVNILNKDKFQEPILESSKVTIVASVYELFMSIVRWIGPHGNILTPNEKYKINYSKDNGKETLQISSLEISDSGIYICDARALDGSSAQDSVEITVYGATDLDTCARKLILRLVFGIICITCIACFVILVLIGGQCALKLGLGFGLVLGICYVGCIIFIVIFVKKVLKPPPAPENRRGKYGRRSDVSRRDAEIQLEDIGLMSNKERTGQQSDESEYAEEKKEI